MTASSSNETPNAPSQDIHVHNHFHPSPEGHRPGGPPWGHRRGGPGGQGRGGKPQGRYGSRRAVIRAFGAARSGRSISSADFSLLQDHQRDLEQRLADLSDLIESIERDGLVEPGAAEE